jgi:hypothetical protein
MGFAQGVFIANEFHWSNEGSAILTSSDGVTWSARANVPGRYLSGFAYGLGTVVAVGSGGGIVQSDPLVNGRPEITQHPVSSNLFAGASVTLQVSAVGGSPLIYQWLKNGSPITGATNAALLLPNLTPANTGSYSVMVSNAFGSVLSQPAVLVVQTLGPPGLATYSYAGLSITGIIGRTYTIQYARNLQSTNDWQTVTNLVLSVTPQVWIDYDSPSSPRRFYRAALLP